MQSDYEEIIIHTKKTYPVLICDACKEVESRIPSNSIIITDSNLMHYYHNALEKYQCIVIPAGEESKQWKSLEIIFGELVRMNAGRDTFLLGFGGGVVLDITGFVASTYKRGCRFGFVATSLLAQVDASVGGKNGINFGGYKNLVGVFNQPEFVVCDGSLLATLPRIDFINGMAEVIKHALIADSNFYDYLVMQAPLILQLDKYSINHIVESSVQIKSGYVIGDEYDQGLRHHLNFGHTFGHAFELSENIGHGYAVAKGMMVAAEISFRMKLCNRQLVEKTKQILLVYNLPVDFTINQEVMNSVMNDKKNRSGKISMVLIKGIGETIMVDFELDELKKIAEQL